MYQQQYIEQKRNDKSQSVGRTAFRMTIMSPFFNNIGQKPFINTRARHYIAPSYFCISDSYCNIVQPLSLASWPSCQEPWPLRFGNKLIHERKTCMCELFRCVHASVMRGSVRPSVRNAFFSMSRLWQKMVGNDQKNSLNAPNSSKSPLSGPKMQSRLAPLLQRQLAHKRREKPEAAASQF